MYAYVGNPLLPLIVNIPYLARSITWNYCILDEGHIIKNTKTKVWDTIWGKLEEFDFFTFAQITRAVKQLRANHRLILSGTPIQVCNCQDHPCRCPIAVCIHCVKLSLSTIICSLQMYLSTWQQLPYLYNGQWTSITYLMHYSSLCLHLQWWSSGLSSCLETCGWRFDPRCLHFFLRKKQCDGYKGEI